MIKRKEVFRQFDAMDKGFVSEIAKCICPFEQGRCKDCILHVDGQSGKLKETFCLPNIAYEYLRSKGAK